jgi:drug/metabolite transporter (DMT)-like permease
VVPVTVSSVSILMTPVISVISSNLMLGEPIGWREIAALVLVCGAMGLVLTPAGSGFRWLGMGKGT